jgi:hypothetical protein
MVVGFKNDGALRNDSFSSARPLFKVETIDQSTDENQP